MAPGTFIKVPPECFIPIPSHSIMKKLVNRIEGKPDKLAFIDFARRLEGVYRTIAYDEHKELRRCFSLFSPSMIAAELVDIADQQLREAEDEFLDRFHKMMEKGNYLMLSQEEYETALKEDYLFNIRAKIDWNNLDGSCFTRFLNRHPEFQSAERKPASLANKVLIYHRGVGVDQTTGLFMMEKVDSLLYRIGNYFLDLLKTLYKLLTFWKHNSTSDQPEINTAESDDPTASDSDQLRSRRVERRNLQTTFNGFNFLSSVKLQEPTFKQMVILYRVKNSADGRDPSGVSLPSSASTSSDPSASSSSSVSKYPISTVLANRKTSLLEMGVLLPQIALKRKPIFIKSFIDVPMADFEMILPEKTIHMNPSDHIKIIIAVITGICAIIFQIFDLEDYFPSWESLTSASNSTSSGGISNDSSFTSSSSYSDHTSSSSSSSASWFSYFTSWFWTSTLTVAHNITSNVSDALSGGDQQHQQQHQQQYHNHHHHHSHHSHHHHQKSAAQIADEESDVDDNILWTLIGIIFTYLMKISFQISAQMDKYNLMMTQSLYHKSMDNHEGVMLYLTDSMQEQEFKEALIAYFFLWNKGDMSMEDLDKTCEQFIETLGETVDFEVDDAIAKLKRDGLVTETRGGTLTAVPLKESTAKLQARWNHHFSDKDVDCPYCPYVDNC